MKESIVKLFTNLDYKGIVAEYVIAKVFDKGLKSIRKQFDLRSDQIDIKAKKALKPDDYESFVETYDIKVSDEFIAKRVIDNINKAYIWSQEISFSLSKSSKELDKVFVDIDVYLAQLKTRVDNSEEIEKTKSSRLPNYLDKNIIIYGGPGAGKTTLIKKIFHKFITNKSDSSFSCPIVIRFRELNYPKPTDTFIENYNIYKILLDCFGIEICFPERHLQNFKKEYNSLQKYALIDFLNQGNFLLIFDGFDEIPNLVTKKIIEKDFAELALSLQTSRFIITSRNGDFKTKLYNTTVFELCPLSDSQILQLAKNWLENEDEAQDLYNKIKASTYYDTTIRPLTLSHLCAIYERRKSIPSKPRYIYDLVIQLLLEIWDEQRGISRPSQYAEFYIEKKKEFLAHLSYCLTYDFKKNQFSSDDIKRCYNSIYKTHNLPASQAKKVVNEIESHSGILVQSGFDLFQFSHKSLQEYLTAKYLFSQSNIPSIEVLRTLPVETAITISLSSTPNDYFYPFLTKRSEVKSDFWSVFLDRLVDEKPDFSDDPIVVVFFITMIYEYGDPIFHSSFLLLIERTNIKISFPRFLKLYHKSQTIKTVTSLLHKDLNKSLIARKLLPGQLNLNSQLFQIILEKSKLK